MPFSWRLPRPNSKCWASPRWRAMCRWRSPKLNARKICELAGRPDVKVYSGAIRPMMRTLVTAENVHGRTGLDGPVSAGARPCRCKASMRSTSSSKRLWRPGRHHHALCAGPADQHRHWRWCVNLALPRASSSIVAMGGGFFERRQCHADGRVQHLCRSACSAAGVASGHSHHADPAGLHPPGADHQGACRDLLGHANRAGPAIARLLDFFERFDEAKYGTDGGPLHDPCVIAWLLKPELFGRDVNVAVETESELTMGMTVIDWWRVTDRQRKRNRLPRCGCATASSTC